MGGGASFTSIRSNRAVISGVTPPTGATHFKIDLYCFGPHTKSSAVYDTRLSELKAIFDAANATASKAGASQADVMAARTAYSGIDAYKGYWKRSPTPLPTMSANGIGLVYSKPPTAYTSNSTVILCDYIIPPVPTIVNTYLAVVSSGPSASGPWTAGELIGPVDSLLAAQAESPADVTACAAAAAAAADAPLSTTTGIAMMGNALSVRPPVAPAAPVAPVAPAAAAPPVPSGPQCANQSFCKANGVVQGTVVKRTTPGEVPMCFYTGAQCSALGGNFAGVSNNLPAGVTGVGECLLKTGGSFTWNCRPMTGGGARRWSMYSRKMRKGSKKSKGKKTKHTRRR